MKKLLNALMLTAVSAMVSAAAFAGGLPAVTLDDTFDAMPDDFAAAVPEPAALIAMGVGLATVAYVVRRRARR